MSQFIKVWRQISVWVCTPTLLAVGLGLSMRPAHRLKISLFLSKPLGASSTGQRSEIRASSTLIQRS